ncbi:low specificity L-threonine aldolase [Marinihelvus fidelis]|uniref:Low specificity L-threonine aldolase n=1 Tax=Marinihelvus fidelis TaxID=2613842 RepID=A0A5N0TEN0_9GAMM|nr:beta-eliminating lyase-related protein [Marinihelvus fidelis]KAA9133440.1 low specificity L-threonine aldolase [Marinihelvus fidelis]
MTANFRSDNESAVAGPVMEAIVAANEGAAHAYAEDDWSMRLDQAFSDLFETPTRVLPMATGTAANSIALATVTPPWGSVLCHRQAHVYSDESGAPEFYGHGLRLVPVDGALGRMSPDALAHAYAGCAGHGVHSYVPSAMTLTQSTESGTVYQPDDMAALNAQARGHGLATHLDGARFANAVVRLGCSPADTSWRAGVEMMSFGASKNGCMAAEALLFFGDERDSRYETAERMRKRGGHLFSKMRYVSAQLLAYINDGLWLELAGNANEQAARFAAMVARHAEAELEYPVEANEVFVRWSTDGFEALERAGIEFLTWPGQDDLGRFVFSHSTTAEDTDRLIAAMGG